MASHDGLAEASAQDERHGNYSGVWLSRYDYVSTGRDAAFTGKHYVVLLQHGDRLTVQSAPALPIPR